MMLAIGFSCVAFINVKEYSFYSYFYYERVLNSVKCFSWIYQEDHLVFVLASVYVLHYIYGFMHVEPSLHPWDEIISVMVYDLF
jgi:hypothetical protein